VNPHSYTQLIFDKGDGEKTASSTNVAWGGESGYLPAEN
jgi:hypothetical protein